MNMGTVGLRQLRTAVVAAFVAALAAGILLPLYTDEIGWRLQERAGFDGVDKLFSQICGPGTVTHPPFWMMPARYFSFIFNSLFPDPLYVRISGILYALCWSGLLLLIVRRISDDADRRVPLTIMAIGFLSMGTMPLLLVWSRPEQPILLAFTTAILIACADRSAAFPQTSARQVWLRCLTITALTLIALSYHVKAVFVAPLFIACIALSCRGRAAHLPRALAAIAVIAATGWAGHHWIHRLECLNNASVLADHSRNNTGAALMGAHGWMQIMPLLAQAADGISIFQYLGLPAPRADPMSHWVAADQISDAMSFQWFLVMILAWAAALLMAGANLAAALQRDWRERRLDSRALLAITLLVTVLGWSATQNLRNVYEASFVVPMMVLAMLLALSSHKPGRRLTAGIGILAPAVGIMGIVSIVLVAGIYGPSLLSASRQRGYIAGQPHSISTFGYSAVRREIRAAAAQCSIGDPARYHGLLLDDVTYFAFMRSRVPDHQFGLFKPEFAETRPIDYLRRMKSDGAVLSCSTLPPDLRARAKRHGQFCCLAPPGW